MTNEIYITNNIANILANTIRNAITNHIADILANNRNSEIDNNMANILAAKDIVNIMDYILAKMLAGDRWAHSKTRTLTFGAICHFVSGSPVAL